MSESLELQLTKGKICLIDAADFHLVMKYSWRACQNTKRKHKWYATATIRTEKGRYTTVSMHRLLMGYPTGRTVDHINGNGLDNRRSNLRLASRCQNMANMRKSISPSTSKFKGVCWVKERKRWHAQLRSNGKGGFLGSFDDEVAAALAYDLAAIEANGQFALTNFPAQLLSVIRDAGITPAMIDQKYAVADYDSLKGAVE